MDAEIAKKTQSTQRLHIENKKNLCVLCAPLCSLRSFFKDFQTDTNQDSFNLTMTDDLSKYPRITC